MNKKMRKMKHIVTIIIFGFLLNGASILHAQQTQDYGHFMDLQTHYDGNRVMLRWMISDYDTWQESITNGFKIERYTTEINGSPVDVSAMNGTYQLLDGALFPLSDAQWTSQFPNNPYAELAQESLYETAPPVQAPTLSDAVDIGDDQNFNFMFALFAANHDFAVAEGLALGWEDLTAQPNHTYMYRVTLNTSNSEFKGIMSSSTISTGNVFSFPPPEQLSAEGEDLAAYIRWNSINHQRQYVGYDIERSSDNVNFSKVNQFPFNFSTSNDELPKFSIYRDSLPNNNTTYYYRVKGLTIFGFSGPPSQSISVKGIPPKLNLYIKVDNYTENNGQVTLDWSSLATTFNTRLKGFNIYRSKESIENFDPVNTSIISPSTRTFTDNNPLPGASYYLIEAVDKNDYNYLSPPYLVQPEDTTPPARPTGVTGSFVTSEQVELSWDANTEADLQGYRVYVANKATGHFTQATIQPLDEATFVYNVDPNFTVDSVYFKIQALDTHENCSEKSVCFSLIRPDVLPPSSPVLHKVEPTPGGIAIGFRFSSSEDVAYHELQRKRVKTPNWETVVKILPNEQPNYSTDLSPNEVTTTCFIDDAILERRDYEYRFIAYDLADNVSSSELVEVRPYDNGVRGAVENFDIHVNCIPTSYIENQGGYNLLDSLLVEYKIISQFDFTEVQKLVVWNVITSAEYNNLITLQPYEINLFLSQRKIDNWGSQIVAITELSWDYLNSELIQDFQIYRSADNSTLMLYKTVAADDMTNFSFKDYDVKPGKRYFYQIMARHLDGGHSSLSKTLTIKIPK